MVHILYLYVAKTCWHYCDYRNYADTYDDREHTSPPFVGQSEQQYDYPPKKDLLLSNTNEEFQQMEPEICNGETSEETTNEQQLDKNVVDNDWEGRYYVDHWEEASDDHLHSGEVADNVIVQRNSLGDDSTSKANTDHQHCFAYQPYNSEANRLNMIAFRPYDLPDNDEALQAKFLNPGR